MFLRADLYTGSFSPRHTDNKYTLPQTTARQYILAVDLYNAASMYAVDVSYI